MLQGFVPTSAAEPPQGGISGLAFVSASPTRPARADMSVKYEAVPKWLLFLAATAPAPVARALAIASVMARCATTWPKPFAPSRSADEGPSRTTPMAARGVIPPSRIRRA